MLCHVEHKRLVTLFGKRIRELREATGQSQEELAHAAGLHRTHVNLIETGKRVVRLNTIGKLAMALQVQPSELMPDIMLRRR